MRSVLSPPFFSAVFLRWVFNMYVNKLSQALTLANVFFLQHRAAAASHVNEIFWHGAFAVVISLDLTTGTFD